MSRTAAYGGNNAVEHCMPKSRLEKIHVAFDGSIKAVYEDNTLLILSAEGQSFTHVSPSGVTTVQLCEFCLNRFASLLTELLDFRNQHIDVPAVCKPYKQQLAKLGQLFQLGYPILDVCWPTTAEQAFEQGLVDLPDKQRVTVHSKCSSAHIVLEYTGLRFAVTYPLLIDHSPATNCYTYTWQTQVFSRNQYPSRWQPALAVATAVAENAAQGFRLQQQHQQQQVAHKHLLKQQQLLTDLTNRLSSSRCSTPHSNNTSPTCRGSPRRSTCSSPVKRYGSPLQRQHRTWQQGQQPQEPTHQQQQWSCGSPASPDRSRYSPIAFPGCHTPPNNAWQQQHHYYTTNPASWQRPSTAGSTATQFPATQAAANPAGSAEDTGFCSSSTGISQLPIHPELLQTLPISQHRLYHHHQQLDQQTSSNSSSSSKLAAALSQALGRRHGSAVSSHGAASTAASGGAVGRGWWLEPSLLLPTDELLMMIWSREATVVFVEDVEEVEVWLHADDTCLFSFQAGAFITHLLPRSEAAAWDSKVAGNLRRSLEAVTGRLQPVHTAAAVAADSQHNNRHSASMYAAAAAAGDDADAPQFNPDTFGLVDGVVDASDMSRVYAATALPELPVSVAVNSSSEAPGLRANSSVKVPVGQIAAAALKFRSAMARVKRYLAHESAEPASITPSAASYPLTSQIYAATAQLQQQQQHVVSAEVQEQQDVPGVGRFTAYADGRVRVVFADRTICNLSADYQGCRLLLPDGTVRTVAAANPVGVEHYVQSALEFAAWSSTSPEERAAALRLQALVAAELRSSARMAAICEWGSARILPEAAACVGVTELYTEQQPAAEAVALLDWRAASAGAGEGLEHAAVLPADICSWGLEGNEKIKSPQPACHSFDVVRKQQHMNPIRASHGDVVGDRQLAVEQMLQANARMLERLKV